MFPSKRAKISDEGFSYTHFNYQNLGDQAGWRSVKDRSWLGDDIAWFEAPPSVARVIKVSQLLLSHVTYPSPASVWEIDPASELHLYNIWKSRRLRPSSFWGTFVVFCYQKKKKKSFRPRFRHGFSAQAWLAWDTQRSACLCRPSAGIKDIYHNTTPYPFIMVLFFHPWNNLYFFLLAALPL